MTFLQPGLVEVFKNAPKAMNGGLLFARCTAVKSCRNEPHLMPYCPPLVLSPLEIDLLGLAVAERSFFSLSALPVFLVPFAPVPRNNLAIVGVQIGCGASLRSMERCAAAR